ncbi:glycosyltransferase [bacterium]|nr:glycosyltransferase [bacterium]
MDLVVVGNAYLADWYRGHNTEIEIIPTGVDCDIHRPRSAPTVRDAFTLGWIGTSSNFGYVRMIFGELERFLDDCRDASFLMVADRRPDWWPDSNPQMRFCRWRADEEVRRIEEMDVGLMPLEESEWTRGKCSFKMLQYMASGKPVVVSPVGMNRDVLELGDCGLAPRHTSDWYAAFEALHADQSLRERLSRGGRAIVLDHFSTEIVAHRYAEVFSRIVS